VVDTWLRSKRGRFASPSINGSLFSLPNSPYLELLLCYLIFLSLSHSFHFILALGFWSIPLQDHFFGNNILEALEDNKKGNAYAYVSYAWEVILFNSFLFLATLDLR
jgi:hypothetical protein